MKEGGHLEEEGADGNVILKRVFKIEAWGRELHRSVSGERLVAYSRECGNEPSDS